MSYRIHLSKENFKFSGTHFTIFGKDKSERLHGHNYYVTVELEVDSVDPKLGLAVDFNEIKPLVRELCDELDERVLIPTKSSFLKITKIGENTSVIFGAKTYSFPTEDVCELPLVNITSEELAKWLADNLAVAVKTKIAFTELLLRVEESRGQAVAYQLTR